MQLLKNVFWPIVLVGAFIVVLRMPEAAAVRALVLAESPTAVPTSMPTPTLVPATSTVVPTATATPIPSATRTLMPTKSPTATRYVVQVSAVERQVKSSNRLITYEAVIDVTVKYSDENKLSVWDGGQIFIMQSVYRVGASFDLNMMKTVVDSRTGKITVTLPAPKLEVPARIGNPIYDYYKSGIKYYFKESDQVEWTKQAQVDAQTMASRRACQIALLDKAATQAEYVVKDLILNIDPRINTRDITVIVPAGTCEK